MPGGVFVRPLLPADSVHLEKNLCLNSTQRTKRGEKPA